MSKHLDSHTFSSLEEIFTSAGVIFPLNDQNFLATEQFVIISESILIKSIFERIKEEVDHKICQIYQLKKKNGRILWTY